MNVAVSVILTLAGLASATAAPEPGDGLAVDSLVTALETAGPRRPALSSEQARITVGRLTLDLTGGSLHPLVAGDTDILVGLYFRGSGRFTYRSEEPLEAQLFSTNVKRSTGKKSKEQALSSEVSEALLFDSTLRDRLDIARSGSAADGDLGAAVSKFQARFAKDRNLPLTHRMAQALIEDSGRFFSAQLRTSGKDYVYVYDALGEQREFIASIQPFSNYSPLSDSRYPSVLSAQRIGGSLLDPLEPRFVLRHVDVELTNPGGETLDLRVRQQIAATAPLRVIALSLLSERFDDERRLPYTVRSITSGGQPLAYSHHHSDLIVQLAEPAAPGEKVEIEYHLSGDILNRPGGDSFWWLPISPWFPLTTLAQSNFTYRATLKVAEPFVPFSSGHLVRRWEEDGLQCAEYELDRPTQFAVALAGKYHTYSEERDGLKITLASYAFAYDKPMQRIANNTFELIKLYEPLLGEFPFDELQIIEINSYGFGIAPPGVIFLTREAFDPSPAGRNFREELNQRMAHEVAHMWWGHVAQMATYDDQWLSESTAEYYAAFAIGRLLGPHKLKAAQRAWRQQADWAKGPESIFLANRLTGEKAPRERYGLLYAKGPLMLQELREEVGDEAFFTILKSFLTNFSFRSATTQKFIELTNFITGKDYGPWFQERLFAGNG